MARLPALTLTTPSISKSNDVQWQNRTGQVCPYSPHRRKIKDEDKRTQNTRKKKKSDWNDTNTSPHPSSLPMIVKWSSHGVLNLSRKGQSLCIPPAALASDLYGAKTTTPAITHGTTMVFTPLAATSLSFPCGCIRHNAGPYVRITYDSKTIHRTSPSSDVGSFPVWGHDVLSFYKTSSSPYFTITVLITCRDKIRVVGSTVYERTSSSSGTQLNNMVLKRGKRVVGRMTCLVTIQRPRPFASLQLQSASHTLKKVVFVPTTSSSTMIMSSAEEVTQWTKCSEWQNIPNVKLGRVLGRGKFARVLHGTRDDSEYAVKQFLYKRHPPPVVIWKAFIHEVNILRTVHHCEYVCTGVGVSTTFPLTIFMEIMNMGR